MKITEVTIQDLNEAASTAFGAQQGAEDGALAVKANETERLPAFIAMAQIMAPSETAGGLAIFAAGVRIGLAIAERHAEQQKTTCEGPSHPGLAGLIYLRKDFNGYYLSLWNANDSIFAATISNYLNNNGEIEKHHATFWPSASEATAVAERYGYSVVNQVVEEITDTDEEAA